MNYNQLALDMHKKHRGKIEVTSKVEVKGKDDLSTAYTPGVAEPCRAIHKNPADVYTYTAKGNLVAVVSDGTAVLGLGDIGPHAAMPVMEGKAVLFKEFSGVDAFPICLDTKDPDEIVNIVTKMSPTFGGINLEDIAAPRCFEIEEKLKAALDIPVFHDDQHGTAIVVTAGLTNALKLVNKTFEGIKVVINGAGSAGIAIAKLLISLGVNDIILLDKQGILTTDMAEINSYQRALVKQINPRGITGKLTEALKNADVFIGVSAPNLVSQKMVESMATDAIIFAMANPDPEILPEIAKAGGAAIIGTGRSDFNNQVNNVLAFPGVFKGALDASATDINETMKIAAVDAIANTLSKDELSKDCILPKPFDPRVTDNVARAVAKAAVDSNCIRKL